MENEKLTLVTELHKPARKNYPCRPVQMRGIDEMCQVDLIEMLPYVHENNSYKYLPSNLRADYKWIDILPTLISKYNNIKHRSIGMQPKDVTAEDEEELMELFEKHQNIQRTRPKLKVGDRVRISKH
ncbi:uncharacterized protein LOC117182593 [Belonocnema kinseyi]|uniref:uncharacterized protein LOC117182593 n=1 Tax=Belonocnema kinseyi TaxID=2817044 RepID=UPI00143DDF52|nr:uncharacterized protein LOC117182593 [Belonocnema kinseyi]